MTTSANPEPNKRAERDLWERTLAGIESVFGRMGYLASLRDDNSGLYEHFGLARVYGGERADRVLRESHERVFAEWLNFSLEDQRRDLELYLAGEGEDLGNVLKNWLTLTPYLAMPPAGAGEAERYLFKSDLELVLDLMQGELES